jgi:hypothetical protein
MDLKYEVASDLPEAIFTREVLARGYTFFRTVRWETSATSVGEPRGWERVLLQQGETVAYALFETEGCLVYVYLSPGQLHADVSGPDRVVTHLCEELERIYPKVRPRNTEIQFRFWYQDSRRRAGHRSRTIRVPIWNDIAMNYAAATAARLSAMMNTGQPTSGGQLTLWHGEPGTGKTFALRALSWVWRDWSDFEYVMDPERFFGETHYMLDVLLGQDDDGEERWRTLILEDTGELVVADVKRESGQGLSRLLNLADGLIGQGLRVQFLLTSNEIAGALHPAVLRPGRCAFEVEFKPLAWPEALAWAEAHDLELPEKRSYRLADLFALQMGKELPASKPRMGFIHND